MCEICVSQQNRIWEPALVTLGAISSGAIQHANAINASYSCGEMSLGLGGFSIPTSRIQFYDGQIMTVSKSAIKTTFGGIAAAAMLVLGAAAPTAPASAQASSGSDYRNAISNNMRACAPGAGPSVRVTINGVKNSSGTIRAQVYNGTRADWLESGRWLNRIELPARRGRMTVCLPVPASGNYAVAVRHDVNGNGSTDIRTDGGAMSNNPSINIFNLGKPGVDETRFSVGGGVNSIAITMKYFG
jgi:uncharacterized protein (DUF2141 family)